MNPRPPTDTEPDAPPMESRRSRARRDRYDLVFNAAITLFIERGYDGTSMEAIADRAGVARASVFNYFQRKQAILAEWATRRRAAVRVVIDEMNISESPIDALLFAYMDAWAGVNEQMREETVACGPAAIRDTDLLTNSGLGAELAAYLDAALKRGELRPDLDPRQCGLLLAAGYFTIVSQWIEADQGQFELHAELYKLTELFLRGVLPSASGTGRRSRRQSA